jgi:hypothetical protein
VTVRPKTLAAALLGLPLLTVSGLGLWHVTTAMATTLCRGLDCIAWTSDESDRYRHSRLTNQCFYLGSPTGIGIFRERPLGGFIRNLLGTEYNILGREFLFIEPRDGSKPIVVINAHRTLIDFPSPTHAFCNRGETTLTLDRAANRVDVAGCPNGFKESGDREAECRVAEAAGTGGSP